MASINEKLTTINNSFASMRSIYGGADNNTSIGELQEAIVPTKGVIPISYNEEGYPSKLRIKDVGGVIKGRLLGHYLWSKVEEVIVDDYITSIEGAAFQSCSQLKSINFTNGFDITEIQGSTFQYCNNLDPSNFLSNKITKIGHYAFLQSGITVADLSGVKELTASQMFYECRKLKKVILSDEVTSLPSEIFLRCSALEEMNFPTKLKYIGSSSLAGTGFKKLSLPDSVQYIYERGMQGCPNLIQLSYGGGMAGTTANGTGPIARNSKLKAVWLGERFTSSSGTSQMMSCSNLKKIFIDLPRATVQTYAGYSTAWGSYCKNIICNDDEGFMTRAEFDNFDWENYQS